MPTKKEAAIALARDNKIIRARDFDQAGLPRSYLRRLCDEGYLVRRGRGLYEDADLDFSRHVSLAETSKRVPHGVISLLSALSFHELTTQLPAKVWMTIGSKARTPAEGSTRLRITRASGDALAAGIERHKTDGVSVPIYCPAKTVADCFKYRSTVGIDVAIEALRDCWQLRKATGDEIWHYAKICRVANLMRPYLESVTFR